MLTLDIPDINLFIIYIQKAFRWQIKAGSTENQELL